MTYSLDALRFEILMDFCCLCLFYKVKDHEKQLLKIFQSTEGQMYSKPSPLITKIKLALPTAATPTVLLL